MTTCSGARPPRGLNRIPVLAAGLLLAASGHRLPAQSPSPAARADTILARIESVLGTALQARARHPLVLLMPDSGGGIDWAHVRRHLAQRLASTEPIDSLLATRHVTITVEHASLARIEYEVTDTWSRLCGSVWKGNSHSQTDEIRWARPGWKPQHRIVSYGHSSGCHASPPSQPAVPR